MNDSDQTVMQVCRCFVFNEDGQILFIRREPRSSYSPGLWEIPGGKSELGEDPRQTLIREVMEETGLVVEVEADPVHQESHPVPDGPRAGQLYRGLFAVGRVTGGELRLSREHIDAVWLEVEKIGTIVDQLSPGVTQALHSWTSGRA